VAKSFDFYTTRICRLCDEALDEIRPLLNAEVTMNIVDVAESDELIAKYGQRIPLIQYGGRELGWPFTTAEIYQLLNEET